ncbi:2OG-Fe(II) oxygenase [Streptomyces chiangmaiensis]
MAGSARERLAELLGGSKQARAFSAQLKAPAHMLGLEVAGVGPVSLPLRAPQAKKLIAVARPALFGRGEETLSDTSVRDTWQIAPDQITLAGPSWSALLSSALEHFRDELGLPTTARLRAEPHALLVYGKGQFFLPHQDSEKDDAMVGTLVLSLPSAHTGGELVIEHAGQRSTHRASKTELTLVAFYADCRHEVTPVRSGYRATLTFNLLAEPGVLAQETGPLTELVHCLDQHFSTPVRQRYATRDLDPPNRLVYLLDHEYTQRGLSWERLKGTDAERAALLRAAAGQAGCESVLALAEVKQTWDAYPAGDAPWDDYYGYNEEDEDEDPATDDDYVVQDLIDDEITLDWWSGPDGTGGEPISLSVHDYEACVSTPSSDLTPYESQYEGYMGNYGNTLDRWYRRAAVVVWPRERAFAARGEAGGRWALEKLRDRIEQETWTGHAPPHSPSPRSGSTPVPDPSCWTAHCTWPRDWVRQRARRCCWSRSTWAHWGRTTRALWLRRPSGTAPHGCARSSTAGSTRGTATSRTGTSGPRGCRICARRCAPPAQVQRWRGCCAPGPGPRWPATCSCGPPPGRPRPAAPVWRS